MIAAAYLRVSTVAQADEDRWGYHRQADDIRRYADAHGMTLAGEYRDAITGKSVTRVGLTKLTSEANRYGAVIVSSIDRLARNLGAGYEVAERLAAAGLAVHSTDMGLVDFEDEASTIQFGIFSTLSHAERLRIVKRTGAALVALAEAGKLPNGITTFGYESDGRNGARIVPEQARVVRRIYRMRLDGHTFHSITDTFNREGVPVARPHRAKHGAGHWYRGTVSQLVRNPTYKGVFPWRRGDRTYELPVPPIVSEDDWRRAQPPRRGAPASSGWPLVGHLRCGLCGMRMSSRTYRRGDRRYEWYRCASDTSPLPTCGIGGIRRAWLEEHVEEAIRTRFTDPAFLRSLLATVNPAPRQDARAAALRAELERVLLAYRRGVFTLDEFASARADIEAQLEATIVPDVGSGVDVAALAEAAGTLSVSAFLRVSRVVIVATKESVRFEVSP